MLYNYTKIVIEQVPTATEPKRNKIFELDFLVDFEINNSIENLSTTAKVTLPKKIKVVTLGNFNYLDKSLFKYGDLISIYSGYLDLSTDFKVIPLLFTGYITKVTNETPITIEACDAMYILKKIACPSITWDTTLPYIKDKKQGPLEKLIEYLFETSKYDGKTLKELNFRFNGDNTETNVGKWSLTSSNSIAQFLEEIKSKFKFTIFFDINYDNDILYNDLYCSLIVYNSKLKNTNDLIFNMQENIISSSLNFKSKEDTLVKIVAVGIFKSELESKKKEIRVEEVVGDIDGDIKTVHFLDNFSNAYFELGITDKMRDESLRKKALALKPKFKMDKAEGSITTFGEPRVNPCNIITLQDRVNIDIDNTKYLVKSVKRTGGVGGYRQEIELDYRYDSLTDSERKNYIDKKGFYDDKDIKID